MDATISQFWNDVCGSSLARKTGLTSFDRETLAAFDREYFSFYPYLHGFIRPALGPNKTVLEIGLGYGTVTHAIASSGAKTTGLDISPITAEFVDARTKMFGLAADIRQGSILSSQLEPQSFDVVVSIGCIHHTGNMPLAIENIAALLRPGGTFLFMVYNAGSYYRWAKYPKDTFSYFYSRPKFPLNLTGIKDRKWYDQDVNGAASPDTAVISSSAMRHILSTDFDNIEIEPQNFGLHSLANRLPRAFWLHTVGRLAGLDLYVSAKKSIARQKL